jgi:hypothetical protein
MMNALMNGANNRSHAPFTRQRLLWPRVCLCLVIGAALAGCAPPALYQWGEYEDSLYQRYVKEDIAGSEAHLRETLVAAELKSRVPPGVYADYGFLLYRRGDYAGAIGYFEKEKRAFPESAALMSKLIERIQQQRGTSGSADQKGVPAGTAQP